MRTLTPVVVALLLVLSGCSGILEMGSEPDRVSVTPAEVPTEDGNGLPPGVTGAGFINPQELVNAHQQVLANESVTINTTHRSVAENGTVLSRTYTTYRVGANRTYAHRLATSNRTESPWEHEIWMNDDGRYSVERTNTTTYRFVPNGKPNAHLLENVIIEYVEISNVSVANISGGDQQHRYRLQGSIENSERQDFELGNDTTKNDTIEMHVDERGFVYKFVYPRYFRQNNSIIRNTAVVRFDTNATAPERPAWVEEAVSATKNETEQPRVVTESEEE